MDKYKKLYKQIIEEGRNNISFSDLQFFLEKTGFSVRCKGISISEKRGDERGIRNLVESLREVSVSESIIIEKLQQKYNFTPEEAQLYLKS